MIYQYPCRIQRDLMRNQVLMWQMPFWAQASALKGTSENESCHMGFSSSAWFLRQPRNALYGQLSHNHLTTWWWRLHSGKWFPVTVSRKNVSPHCIPCRSDGKHPVLSLGPSTTWCCSICKGFDQRSWWSHWKQTIETSQEIRSTQGCWCHSISMVNET